MGLDDILYKQRKIESDDERRTLATLFNGDFTAKQGKILEIKEDSILGKHYHNYSELYYLHSGNATFEAQDIETKESRTIHMVPGDEVLIPSNIAHKVTIKKGSVLIGFTEKPYKSAEKNSCPYEF
jgi:oxalate decarboxylase/phosphoglucose isomerase-like protein (cupin superfamily)